MMPNIGKKLREAQFFLEKMRDQEKRAFGDKEPFDFYLSAFLSAVRTVDYRLRHEEKATYPAWRTAWNAAHAAEDKRITFLNDDRRLEVHESGSTRMQLTEEIKVGMGGSYSDRSGTLQVFGCPSPLVGVDTGTTIYKPRYVFMSDEQERSATDVCAEGLRSLEQMVAQYSADQQRQTTSETPAACPSLD